MNILVHTDGGARGNPGPSAIGVVIECVNLHSSDKIIQKIIHHNKYIGNRTNNEAEYEAVIGALTQIAYLCKNQNEKIDKIEIFLDSLLVCNQLKGIYKIKKAHLQLLLLSVKRHEQDLGVPIFYKHIPRENNQEADRLVNEALDKNI